MRRVFQFVPQSAILTACLALTAGPSLAQNDPSAYCSAGPICNITRDIEVTSGSDVDFGDRIVNLSGILSVRSGSMTIRAAEVRIVSQGQLNGNRGDGGGSFAIITTGDIRIDGTRASGAVQVSGLEGGVLTLQSTSGRVFGSGVINAHSEGDPLGDGGFVDVMAGSVSLTGEIDVTGGLEAGGGDIEIVAGGDVSLMGFLDLQGGEDGGGSLFIDSGGKVTLGEVELDGQGELGDGGCLDVTAESAALTGRIRGRGSNSLEFCGDSAELTVAVDDLLEVTGEIDVDSRRDCFGGTIDFSAGTASLRGPIKLRAEGVDGVAGSMTVFASQRIECLANGASIDGRGNEGAASVMFGVDSVEATTETTIDCAIVLSGADGSFDLEANTNVVIGGDITVGSSQVAAGFSPLISVEGCTVRITAAAELLSQGNEASNLVIAREQTNVAGSLQANGVNEFRFRPGLQPTITGQVVPAPSLMPDESILSCGFATGTPTVTRTATVTRTPTPSPSPSLVCIGDCNEDGMVSVDELVVGIDIGLGYAPVSACPPLDEDHDGQVDISETVTAVSNSLNECAIVR